LEMAHEKPLPQPNADNVFFWDGCREHKLLVQKCLSCGLVRWPPSLICPGCNSRETEVIEATGKGKVYTYAIYHQAYHPGFESDIPYVTAVIELDEGPHFLSNLVGCEHNEIRCEMQVEVVWEGVSAEFSLPKFKPAS